MDQVRGQCSAVRLSSLATNKLMCKLASWSLKVASSSPFQLKEIALLQSLVTGFLYFIELDVFFWETSLFRCLHGEGKVFLKLPIAGQVLI